MVGQRPGGSAFHCRIPRANVCSADRRESLHWQHIIYMTNTTARDREFRAILNILRIRLESVNEAIRALEEVEGQLKTPAPRDHYLAAAVRPTA